MSDHSDAESNQEERETDQQAATDRHDVVAGDWTMDSMNKLIHHVMSQTAPGETTPYHLKDIDWDVVSWGSHSPSDCQRKWEELLTKVRHYRTLLEIGTDMIGFLVKKKANAKVLQWNRKMAKTSQVDKSEGASVKKKKGKDSYPPDYPMKPRNSAYSVFSSEKMAALKTKFHGTGLVKEVGRLWGQLSDREKSKYRDKLEEMKASYLDKLQSYSNSHPEDERIKQLIDDEERARNTVRGKNKAKITPSKSQNQQTQNGPRFEDEESKENTGSTNEKSDSVNDVVASTSKDSPSKSKKNKKKDKLNTSVESMLDSGIETNNTVTESPAKKRPHGEDDASVSETPSKKKKKKHKVHVVTGLQLYVEEKLDSYRLEHPDLSEEEIHSKLQRKYAKLSDKKTKKYEQVAAEMN